MVLSPQGLPWLKLTEWIELFSLYWQASQMDFQTLAALDESRSFLFYHREVRFASCWTEYCLLTTYASSRFRKDQLQNTHPCCVDREYTHDKRLKDAPSNRNAWSFNHDFDTYRLKFLRFDLNLLIASTCQSLLMQAVGLEWLSRKEYWSWEAICRLIQLLSTFFCRLDTLFYCSSKSK
jgi:hypothetical protein